MFFFGRFSMLLTDNSPQSRSQCPQQRVGKSEVVQGRLLLYRPVCEGSFLSICSTAQFVSGDRMNAECFVSVTAINGPIARCITASVIFSARILAPLKYDCQRFVTEFFGATT